MPTLELSMIVRNGAVGLRRCLDSVRGIVDRIVIGDTGSSDETLSIAAEYGAEVVSVPWRNDFAQARNVVLSQARCDWVLVLDADEMLDSAARTEISQLIQAQGMAGYDTWRWNYVRDAGYRSSGEQAVANPMVMEQAREYPAYFRTFHTRLFRRDPKIRFEHCVHENVSDRMDALHLRRGIADFVIHHFGYVDDAGEQRKNKDRLYYELSLTKAARFPRSYQANLEAGMSEFDYAKNPAAALPYFVTAHTLEPQRAPAWLYGGMCLTRMNRHAEALRYLEQAAVLDGKNLLVHSSLGDLFFQAGNYSKASDAYVRAKELGDASPLSGAKLGATEVHLGRRERGLSRVQEAIAKSPECGELYDILATTAFLAGEHATACEAASRRLSMEAVSGFHFFLAATVHLHTNRQSEAEEILQAGLLRFPQDADLQGMRQALGLVNA